MDQQNRTPAAGRTPAEVLVGYAVLLAAASVAGGAYAGSWSLESLRGIRTLPLVLTALAVVSLARTRRGLVALTCEVASIIVLLQAFNYVRLGLKRVDAGLGFDTSVLIVLAAGSLVASLMLWTRRPAADRAIGEWWATSALLGLPGRMLRSTPPSGTSRLALTGGLAILTVAFVFGHRETIRGAEAQVRALTQTTEEEPPAPTIRGDRSPGGSTHAGTDDAGRAAAADDRSLRRPESTFSPPVRIPAERTGSNRVTPDLRNDRARSTPMRSVASRSFGRSAWMDAIGIPNLMRAGVDPSEFDRPALNDRRVAVAPPVRGRLVPPAERHRPSLIAPLSDSDANLLDRSSLLQIAARTTPPATPTPATPATPNTELASAPGASGVTATIPEARQPARTDAETSTRVGDGDATRTADASARDRAGAASTDPAPPASPSIAPARRRSVADLVAAITSNDSADESPNEQEVHPDANDRLDRAIRSRLSRLRVPPVEAARHESQPTSVPGASNTADGSDGTGVADAGTANAATERPADHITAIVPGNATTSGSTHPIFRTPVPVRNTRSDDAVANRVNPDDRAESHADPADPAVITAIVPDSSTQTSSIPGPSTVPPGEAAGPPIVVADVEAKSNDGPSDGLNEVVHRGSAADHRPGIASANQTGDRGVGTPTVERTGGEFSVPAEQSKVGLPGARRVDELTRSVTDRSRAATAAPPEPRLRRRFNSSSPVQASGDVRPTASGVAAEEPPGSTADNAANADSAKAAVANEAAPKDAPTNAVAGSPLLGPNGIASEAPSDALESPASPNAESSSSAARSGTLPKSDALSHDGRRPERHPAIETRRTPRTAEGSGRTTGDAKAPVRDATVVRAEGGADDGAAEDAIDAPPARQAWTRRSRNFAAATKPAVAGNDARNDASPIRRRDSAKAPLRRRPADAASTASASNSNSVTTDATDVTNVTDATHANDADAHDIDNVRTQAREAAGTNAKVDPDAAPNATDASIATPTTDESERPAPIRRRSFDRDRSTSAAPNDSSAAVAVERDANEVPARTGFRRRTFVAKSSTVTRPESSPETSPETSSETSPETSPEARPDASTDVDRAGTDAAPRRWTRRQRSATARFGSEPRLAGTDVDATSDAGSGSGPGSGSGSGLSSGSSSGGSTVAETARITSAPTFTAAKRPASGSSAGDRRTPWAEPLIVMTPSPRSANAANAAEAGAAGWSAAQIATWSAIGIGLVLCARRLTAGRRPHATTRNA
ncbi:MAG: hypothetical protein AB8G96_03255 [Phycisphaerales bacterium]